MTLIVKKFGGSSVATLERIEKVADIIIESLKENNQLVVVVSAMFGDTDKLINMAKYFHDDPDPREYAALISTGELLSMSLLSMALIAKGYRAKSFSAYQAGIVTDSNYKKAQIMHIDVEKIKKELNSGHIVVIAGFQGIDLNGDITTLGRGGSDTTAIAIASALKADECQIYTDVDGVYTADPKVAMKARKLESIDFEEMYELASVGAKVLQTRAVEFCGLYKTPVRVLSSYTPGSGTLIRHDHIEIVKPAVHAIAYDKNTVRVTLLSFPQGSIAISALFENILSNGFEVDMLNYIETNTNKGDLSFTITRDDLPRLLPELDLFVTKYNVQQVVADSEVVKLSLVGLGLRTSSNGRIIKHIFSILKDAHIPIQMISLSETKVSLILDEKYLVKSVNLLHDELGLADKV